MQSACHVQPVLVAYDTSGNIIEKLGSNDQPWPVVASILGSSNASVHGVIANYSDEQTQFSTFGATATDSYQIRFAFILPRATVSFYTSLQHQGNGSLIFSSSSTAIVNSTAGTITATNLAISEIGMYILSLEIKSTNNQFDIPFMPNAVLVKGNSTTLETFFSAPPSYITFKGDYYAMVSAGSVKCSFGTSSRCIGAGQNLRAGITTLTTSGVNNLKVIEANIDARSYIASSSSDVSSSNRQGSNVGLIVGFTVGFGCFAILIVITVVGYQIYTVTSPDLLNLDTNDYDAPLPNNKKQPRVPSAALSVTLLENMLSINNIPNEPMPPAVFIQFDCNYHNASSS
ncbi:unnamed protein product [Rotaria socialis]|uniref:Transmembrane protein n=2 Tax=Rotaria socialis TaxID=392032 RepID=A0A818NGF8_9BILA|nr:unnamed protein product [Rotaria socialis]